MKKFPRYVKSVSHKDQYYTHIEDGIYYSIFPSYFVGTEFIDNELIITISDTPRVYEKLILTNLIKISKKEYDDYFKNNPKFKKNINDQIIEKPNLRIGSIFKETTQYDKIDQYSKEFQKKIETYEIVGQYYKGNHYYYSNKGYGFNTTKDKVIPENTKVFQILITVSKPEGGGSDGTQNFPEISYQLVDISEEEIVNWFISESKLLPEYRKLSIIQ